MLQGFLPPKEFKSIYSKVPRLCVDLIIKTQGGVLLTLRSLPDWKGYWHIPGGTVRYKETLEQAVTRIAQEELHMSVEILKSLGYIEYPSEEKERGFGWSVSIPILCVPKSEEFSVGEGASEVKVFTELPDTMVPEQRTFLTIHWADLV